MTKTLLTLFLTGLLMLPLLGTALAIDTDGDGFADATETYYGTDPASATSTPATPEAELSGQMWDSYWYSRYYLFNQIMASGSGYHLVHSSMFDSNQSMMMGKIMTFANLTGATPPMNGFPIFAEFASATPAFAGAVDVANMGTDFGTLRWDLSSADTDIVPAALGQTGLKQILWAEDFLGTNHNLADNSTTQDDPTTGPMTMPGATGVGLGAPTDTPNNLKRGFRGLILTGEQIGKMLFLKETLAVNITNGQMDGGLDPATNAGMYYFPHRTEVTTMSPGPGMPPMPTGFTVVDADLDLWDQLSLLWWTARFHQWSADPAQDDVFGGNGMGAQPFPGAMADTDMPGPQDLSKGLSAVTWMSMTMSLWNNASGTFVDSATYDSTTRMFVPGSVASTATVALAVPAVAQWSSATMDMMGQKAFATRQADFLIDSVQADDGGFANSYDLSAGAASTDARTLASQTAALRALGVAFDLTGDAKYSAAAQAAFDFMEAELWDEANGVYRSAEGATSSSYDARDIGTVIGGLRSLMLIGDDPLAHYRYTQFFANVVSGSGFQQSELAPTGESSDPPDKDGDGIMVPPMATYGGDHAFGTAPVAAGEVTLSSAGTWSVSDRTFYTDQALYAANEMFLTGFRSGFETDYTAPSETFAEALAAHGAALGLDVSLTAPVDDSTGDGSDTTDDGTDTTGDGSDTTGDGADTTGDGSDTTGDGTDTTGDGSETTGDSTDEDEDEDDGGFLPFLTLPLMVAAVLGVALVLVFINRKD